MTHSNTTPADTPKVKALILTGYGLNCDYETDFSLRAAGALPRRVHINEIIAEPTGEEKRLSDYQILIFGGGFSWADDHGAGVLMATKLRHHLGEEIEKFIEDGKLILGICNGFQCLVNLGLLPGFEKKYTERHVALTYNDSGNFVDNWVNLKTNPDSPCVFSKNIDLMELPVRHGEGKIHAADETIKQLVDNHQIVMQYADDNGNPAGGRHPWNPNGSILDIAGICDPTGRIFGLMPHPEAYNHMSNHPNWTLKKEEIRRKGKEIESKEGAGIQIFRNAVEYMEEQIPE